MVAAYQSGSEFGIAFALNKDIVYSRKFPATYSYQQFCEQLQWLYGESHTEFDAELYECLMIDERSHGEATVGHLSSPASYEWMVHDLVSERYWKHVQISRKFMNKGYMCFLAEVQSLKLASGDNAIHKVKIQKKEIGENAVKIVLGSQALVHHYPIPRPIREESAAPQGRNVKGETSPTTDPLGTEETMTTPSVEQPAVAQCQVPHVLTNILPERERSDDGNFTYYIHKKRVVMVLQRKYDKIISEMAWQLIEDLKKGVRMEKVSVRNLEKY